MPSPDAPAPRERREPWHKIKFTPDAYAEIRRLYEQTPETARTIAAIAGISHTSLKGYAAREGWVKFRRPPIDLPPAAKLSAKLALGEGVGGEGARGKGEAASL